MSALGRKRSFRPWQLSARSGHSSTPRSSRAAKRLRARRIGEWLNPECSMCQPPHAKIPCASRPYEQRKARDMQIKVEGGKPARQVAVALRWAADFFEDFVDAVPQHQGHSREHEPPGDFYKLAKTFHEPLNPRHRQNQIALSAIGQKRTKPGS